MSGETINSPFVASSLGCLFLPLSNNNKNVLLLHLCIYSIMNLGSPSFHNVTLGELILNLSRLKFAKQR